MTASLSPAAIYFPHFRFQKEGQTPLHMVSADGNELFVRFFYAAGADPNIPDNEEQTPLHLATANGHTRVVDVLTEKFKASLTARTKVSTLKYDWRGRGSMIE